MYSFPSVREEMKEQKKRNAFPADHADLMQRRSTAESIINKKNRRCTFGANANFTAEAQRRGEIQNTLAMTIANNKDRRSTFGANTSSPQKHENN
jgi:hypothetical protein